MIIVELSSITAFLFMLIVLVATFGLIRIVRRRQIEQPSRTPITRANEVIVSSPTVELQDNRELLEGLTRREKQVVRLAAEGMTDLEIGKELSISEKTVGNHLYNIYSKLDIHSRRELKHLLRPNGGD